MTNLSLKQNTNKSKAINVDNYEYILVLAWNFFDAIVKNNKDEFQKVNLLN